MDKIPETLHEAIREGFHVDGAISDISDDEHLEKGYLELMRGAVLLHVPFTAQKQFGKPYDPKKW